MGEVYRVWGSRLGNGAYLLAESEQEATKVVAGVFKLDEASLKAAPDKTVGLPSSGIILESSGKTDEFVPSARPHTMNVSWPKAVFKPIETKDGEWSVRLSLPGGRRPVVDGFKSEAEAREWIKTDSIPWIERMDRKIRRRQACVKPAPPAAVMTADDVAMAPTPPGGSRAGASRRRGAHPRHGATASGLFPAKG